MSASVVDQPRLSRTAPWASSAPIPMASSTCEGWTLPDEQAEPDDTAIPARSKPMTAVSALEPGNREQRGIGQPRRIPRRIRSFQGVCLRPSSRRSSQVPAGAPRRPSGPPSRPWSPRRTPKCPRHSRCRPGARVPARRRAAAAPGPAPPRPEPRRPTPLGPPILCADSVSKIGSYRFEIKRDFSERLDRIDMQQPARGMDDVGHLGHRLHGAGLVVGQHHRHQRRRAVGKQRAQVVEIDEARAVTLMVPIASGGNRPPASTEACSIAETNSRWTGCPRPRRSPGVSASALASVPPEENTTSCGRRADRRGDRGPRILDQPARLPALGVNRGRVAAQIPRAQPSPAAPRGEAAWSHSSRDRPGQALPYNITYYRRLQASQVPRRGHAALSQLVIAASAGNRKLTP